MTTKAWYYSKTVWLNIIAFLILALTLPQLGAVIPTADAPIIALIVALLNGVVRVFFTSTTLTSGSTTTPTA